MAVACITGRHHAVKHVDTCGNAFDQILRRADAHQVARLVGGQAVRRMRHDALHFFLGLAHAHAANRIAGQVQLDQSVERFLPQIFKHTALHDAEQCVRVLKFLKLGHAAAGPALAEFHRRARFSLGGDMACRVIRRTFIKLHDDVAVQQRLDLHRDFRC